MKHTLQQLKVKPGEPPTAEKWNGLLKAINQLTLLRSPNLFIRQTPQGVMAMARPGAKAFKNWPFRIREGEAGITFDYGLIAGIEPVINLKPISGWDFAASEDSRNNEENIIPELEVEPGDKVYFVMTFDPETWAIVPPIELLVQTEEEAVITPWKAFKLAAVVTEEGVIPMVFFNLGHYASERQPNGYARHWFYAM